MGLFRVIRLAFYAAFLALLAIGYYVYIQAIEQPLDNRQKSLHIPKGVGISWLANHLEDEQIIKSKKVFRAYTWINYRDITIKAGEYTLLDIDSIPELLSKLHEGKVKQYAITLVDGLNFKQYKAQLLKQTHLKHELNTMSDEQIMRAVGSAGVHPEGQFAPETYFYQKGDSDLSVLQNAHKRLNIELEQAWQLYLKEHPHNRKLKNAYELLILASIIEKETGQASERAIISGVFHNRLNIGMKLQTDPTVIYGMGEAYRGNIRRKDLTTDTPYNTYTRYGLPPSPIAMAGQASLMAAAQPATTKSLYFVGKGDGSHYFSENLQQHNNAVIKYQLKGRRTKK